MLQPVVRRTWAARGKTPVLRQQERHDRLSVISAVTLAPRRRRLGLYWRILADNLRGPDVVAFLRALRRQLRRRMVLIWDRWHVHRSRVVRAYAERHAANLRLEWLPPYAPELNPTEQVWNHAKYVDLANFCPDDRYELCGHLESSLWKQRSAPELLRSFFKTAELDL